MTNQKTTKQVSYEKIYTVSNYIQEFGTGWNINGANIFNNE